jgi:hypothetical protein
MFGKKCQEIADCIFDDSINVYLVEKQSWRPLGLKQTIPHSILRSAAVESMLFAILLERTKSSNALVKSFPPKAMASHFEINSKDNYRFKKLEATRIVNDLIANGNVSVDEPWMSQFCDAKKKDDYSDCLLNGLAYCDWHAKTLKYLKENGNS